MVVLERVQGRFTRMLPGSEGGSYGKGLDMPGFFSLEQRMQRTDLVEKYKIMSDIYRVDRQNLYSHGQGYVK